ncbi:MULTISPECIES: hypothetical protein [Clostridium]|jgi:hypothetical protein|uniref:Uncharacterized protein n=2 Tax=Clostridium beijerinckii TaxID=1520 RepID=A0A1S8RJV3_CLOBE|nr:MULTISPECIES: hypothetical protein [Clostridium]ABR36695.1 hypothetical protein Cbei_4587 [Clostridium beijerinckii NCIMB 8052]AIU05192.1 hypothetical protein Cbs_4587 [Clostridium beijerinckii ATCC 35702]MBF7808659.1 hypothetical protein [Clostridium beijerinckii]MCI1476946.1 hypothetical protein [Clostridium beijerinckii]MCI1578276.1 hypothetical protein [Clostridium beijerinckii]
MLNEKALKKVGPSYEEVGAKKDGGVTPTSDISVLTAATLISATYTVTITATND